MEMQLFGRLPRTMGLDADGTNGQAEGRPGKQEAQGDEQIDLKGTHNLSQNDQAEGGGGGGGDKRHKWANRRFSRTPGLANQSGHGA